MLSNLWQTVNGGDSQPYKDVFASDDETALLTDNEDELADRLLSQFPAYGTNVKLEGVGFDVDDNDQDDDMLGASNAPIPIENKTKKDSSHRRSDSGWDDDEDRLWKSQNNSSLVPRKWKKHSSSSLSSTAGEPDPNEGKSNTTNKKSSFYEWNDSQRRAWVDGGGGSKSTAKTTPKEPTSPVLSRYLLSPTFGRQSNIVEPQEDPSASSFSFRNKQQDDRQHWMPDKLCKQCYACDVPFTVFRRRHHCRLCGQVFCSNCSAYFVELAEFDHQEQNRTMRACKMCFEGTSSTLPWKQPSSQHSTNTTTAAIVNSPKSSTSTEKRADGSRQLSPSEQTSPPQQKQKQQGNLLVDQMEGGSVLSGLTQKQRTEGNNKPNPLDQLTDLTDGQAAAALANRIARRRLAGDGQQQQQKQPPLQPILDDDDSSRKIVPAVASKLFKKEALASATLASSKQMVTSVDAANRKLGLTAASHLELLGTELLKTEAPLLLMEHPREQAQWINTLMTLATRCCATVVPNVKKGDLLDLRPYCKIKVIAGGSHKDCAYMSGVVFRKNVSHKRMAKEISNPRIMLLSGGIEFTRSENQIASLDTLLEQEEKYMEILVGKILKLNPNVLLVGKSVSRKAQELLLRARVVLIQHVKTTLMSRISRQTGATIISSTDHVMNQFDESVLGNCRRFRLVTFRDNETWVADMQSLSEKRPGHLKNGQKNQTRVIQYLLADQTLSNHERQAALAANVLGESVLDGTEAVKRGLAKRGVAQTYVLLEGCPKHLGCTVVLRGSSRAALKQVKRVFRFLVNVAYNLKLETTYLRERCAKLPASFKVTPNQLYSSSLCVDYGGPPSGRKVRPWNGRNSEATQRSGSGKVTAFDHQSILVTSVWMTGTTQCCPAEVKGICYYSLQDVSLGQFLRDSCFNLSLKCQNSTCKKSVLDHSLSFIHNDGLINITVEHMDDPLPPSPLQGSGNPSEARADDEEDDSGNPEVDSPIATWTYCVNCGKVVTPLVYISEETWKLSFGKFLESFFYNRDAVMNSPEHGCSCQMQSAETLYFGCGRLAARFAHERVRPYGVFVRRTLPIDESFHQSEALRHLEKISVCSSELFVRFDKHIHKVSREARSLLGSAANRPEHLQTVLAELGSISLEVDHAAKTLHDKIASVSDKCRQSVSSSKDGSDIVNEALFRFPWFSRRNLFMLTSAWNERLSAIGQALVAMKKLAAAAQRGDIVISPNVVPGIAGDGTDDLKDYMRRIRELNEVYSQYNVTDISTVLPTLVGSGGQNPELEIDDDWDAEGGIDFADGVDADVLASRRRLYTSKPMSSLDSQSDRGSEGRPMKSLGTPAVQHQDAGSGLQRNTSRGTRDPSPIPTQAVTKSKTVTPGGAVKSAFNRFFNRGWKELDPYVVDLGIFNEGRPRLEVGVGGIVVPVMDDLPSTVVAYSLSSAEYAQRFEQFSKGDGVPGGDRQTQTSGNRSNDEASDRVEPTTNQPRRQSRKRVPSPSPQRSRSGQNEKGAPPPLSQSGATAPMDEKKDIERRMLLRNKSHIKHTFRDFDEKGQQTCKFVCTAYWATQFHAVRQAFLTVKDQSPGGQGRSASPAPQQNDVEKCYIQSLSSAFPWAASGGKSGASFARTADERFVIKCISRTELQMFLDCAPAYFEYLSKAFFHGLPTVLCKIVGVYQIGYHDRVTGKRSMEQVAVMQNIFYGRKISKIFDLKGSLRGRFAKDKVAAEASTHSALARVGSDSELSDKNGDDENTSSSTGKGDEEDPTQQDGKRKSSEQSASAPSATLLDGDFLEFTSGRPLPLTDRAKAVFHMSVLNDTLFLSIINVLDYSILVGIDEEKMELVVGIIDFMRQYDILKQMERVGKSLPMVVGSEAPTIIQPPLYKARFTNAMERYFMTVPNKWTVI